MLSSPQHDSTNPLPKFEGLSLDETLLTGTESTVADFKRLLEALKAKFDKAKYSPAPLIFSQGNVVKSKTPIIFLDFDGVCWVDDLDVAHQRYRALSGNQELLALLNAHFSMLNEHFDFESVDEFLKFACFEYKNMQRIKSLCQEFNARIVVTSNWRMRRSVSHLKSMLNMWGLGQYVIDKTADNRLIKGRVNQITEWQKANKQSMGSYVVIDDQYVGDLTPAFQEKFIFCDPKKAFDHEAYLRAHCCLQAQSVLAKTNTIEATQNKDAQHSAIPSG